MMNPCSRLVLAKICWMAGGRRTIKSCMSPNSWAASSAGINCGSKVNPSGIATANTRGITSAGIQAALFWRTSL